VSFATLFLALFLVASTAFAPALNAQAPAAGTTVTVKMLDAVDSSSDSAGKQYRAAVTKALTASNGVAIAQGSAAMVTLRNSGSGYTAQLSSIAINGQAVAVTSSSASLTAGAQTAAGSAVNSINSVIGEFGHHVNSPAASAATAIATGQRVVLPSGTTLNFVLDASAAPPAARPVVNYAAPAQMTAAAASAPLSAQAYYTLCRYQGQQDGHPVIYVAPIIHTDHGASDISQDFNIYMKANYDINKIQQGSGYCRTVSNSPDQQAFTLQQLDKQWADSKTVVTRLTWTDSPSEMAAANAKLKAAAAVASAATAGGPFISCSTGSGPGVDTYFTGIFQTTRPIRHMPNGANIVDASILDDFYAYLKQKGYNFKPGSAEGCDVKPTEEATKAAQHTRAYGGGGGLGVNCCGNGKVVETGWKE
jgi:hypothetical protein